LGRPYSQPACAGDIEIHSTNGYADSSGPLQLAWLRLALAVTDANEPAGLPENPRCTPVVSMVSIIDYYQLAPNESVPAYPLLRTSWAQGFTSTQFTSLEPTEEIHTLFNTVSYLGSLLA
jgi:hypothetical protein